MRFSITAGSAVARLAEAFGMRVVLGQIPGRPARADQPRQFRHAAAAAAERAAGPRQRAGAPGGAARQPCAAPFGRRARLPGDDQLQFCGRALGA